MKSPQKRASIVDIRRSELVQAAHRVFKIHGLSGMTTGRICKEAGMSPGILSYYFKGKEEVLFDVVRYNNRILMEDIIKRLRQAETKWQRLMAIIEGNFPDHAFERNTANAWLSVCAEATTHSGFGRLQYIFYKRLRSNLANAFDGTIDADLAQKIILGVGVMIDGLWLRKAADYPITRQEAVVAVQDYLKAMLPKKAVLALKGSECGAN